MRKPELKTLPIEKCQRGRYQPRQQFSQAELEELAQSIRVNGLIQPIVVRPISPTNFEIVAGERRWRAAQLAGLMEIDCLIHHYGDEQAAEISAIENISRVDLNPIEEAQAYQRLVDEFSYTHDEISAVMGKSRTHISNMLRLLKLANEVQRAIIEGHLSGGHGKVLAIYPIHIQTKLAERCIARGWSVRKLESEAKKMLIDDAADDVDPNLDAVSRALSEHLGCPVSFEFSRSKGRVSIDFHNLDILHGLFEKMGFSTKDL